MFDLRTRQLIGDAAVAQLAETRILVAGLGGVGSFAVEALARAGVGQLILVDHDTVALSNINRQLLALNSTVGQRKVDVMAERIGDINPNCRVEKIAKFLQPEDATWPLTPSPHYILDCIDTIATKVALVKVCQARTLPIASSMGAGGRIDPTQLRIDSLANTTICPLARVMRKRLREAGASLDFPVVYSLEVPIKGSPHAAPDAAGLAQPRSTNGTIAYLPGLMGLMLAGFAIARCLRL